MKFATKLTATPFNNSLKYANKGEARGSYLAWLGMRRRCLCVSAKEYPSYGGRGITICDRWLKFENFLEDMGIKPEGKTLDRIDVNGGYCQENCRWATASQQQRNKTNTRYLTLGVVKRPLIEWVGYTGFPLHVLRKRLHDGWSDEAILTTPLRSGGYSK